MLSSSKGRTTKESKFNNLTMFSSSKGRMTKKSKIQKSNHVLQIQGQDDEKVKNSKISPCSPAPRAERKSQKFKNLTMFSSSMGRITKKSKIQKSNHVLQLQGLDDEKVKNSKIQKYLPA